MSAQKWVAKPEEVEAMQWTGDNWAELQAFSYGVVTPEWLEDFTVWNIAQRNWVDVSPGDWVIKGTWGELYPIGDDVIREMFEPILNTIYKCSECLTTMLEDTDMGGHLCPECEPIDIALLGHEELRHRVHEALEGRPQAQAWPAGSGHGACL